MLGSPQEPPHIYRYLRVGVPGGAKRARVWWLEVMVRINVLVLAAGVGRIVRLVDLHQHRRQVHPDHARPPLPSTAALGLTIVLVIVGKIVY